MIASSPIYMTQEDPPVVPQTSTYAYRFHLPVDRDAVFALFADPRWLDRLTPPWFRLRPLEEIPETLGVGSEISYRLRWRGLPFVWTSVMTDWRAPAFFAYEQKRGPYRFFRHEHFFEDAAGGTDVLDRVLYRAPGGTLADRLIAGPDLRRIFAYRERRALRLFRDGMFEPAVATGKAAAS